MAGVRASIKRARQRMGYGRKPRANRYRPEPSTSSEHSEASDHDLATDVGKYAAMRLRIFILSKFAAGLFFATDVAAIAYWCDLAGMALMNDLGSNPDLPSFQNNASRKVSSSSGLDSFQSKLYWADVPLVSEDEVRHIASVPFFPIEEALIDEFQKSPAAIRNFVANLDTPHWQQHELRRRVGEEVDVIPFGMFEDPEGLRQIRRPFKPQSDPDCGLTVIQVGSEGALRLLLGASWDPLGARGGRLGPSEGFREVSRRP